MQWAQAADGLWVQADTYRLTFAADRPFVYVDDAQGNRLAELFALSSIHALNGRDDTTRIGVWDARESPNQIVVALHADSSHWQSKTYRFCCQPERLVYEMEVEGEGQLAEVNYFGGYYSGQTRWGSGFFWSGQHFTQGFNPEPNSAECVYFSPDAGAAIDIMGVPLPAKADWFFTPPPFCFVFDMRGDVAWQRLYAWMGMGVEARAGAHGYTEYTYHAQHGAFYLCLSFEGQTRVHGTYQLPSIGFDFGASEYAVLEAHCRRIRELTGVQNPSRLHKPSWWREPIWCGWGAQCYVEAVERRYAYFHCRQAWYESWLRTLEANGVNPGIVVLDDKWQATYGDNRVDESKWHDLRGFVGAQHARGRKVLLWLKAWSPEGVPDEECITNAAGLPLAIDPTHPRAAQRIRDSVRHMLAADGYDADGFKMDFTARIPSGPHLRLHGALWGLKLMRLYLGIIYDEAKRTKPDALIMTHTPNPYLADVLDMIRLNDMNRGTDLNRAMQHRARVARIACPDALIDSDNWPVTDKAAWRAYTRIQPELGVPSLYFATHIDATQEPLDADDYALIRETWAKYRENLNRESAKRS